MKIFIMNLAFACSFFLISMFMFLGQLQMSLQTQICFIFSVVFLCLMNVSWRMKPIKNKTKLTISFILWGLAIFSVVLFPSLALEKFNITMMKKEVNNIMLFVFLGIITTINAFTLPKEMKKHPEFN